MVVIEQNRLYSGKSGLIRVKVVLFGQSGCFRIKCLYSGKNGYIRAKVVLLPKVVVFGQSGCIRVN